MVLTHLSMTASYKEADILGTGGGEKGKITEQQQVQGVGRGGGHMQIGKSYWKTETYTDWIITDRRNKILYDLF